jgi:hypothetical protein
MKSAMWMYRVTMPVQSSMIMDDINDSAAAR